MSGKRTRRRRGHPRGKAFGFHNLRPAAGSGKSRSGDTGATTNTATNTQENTGGGDH